VKRLSDFKPSGNSEQSQEFVRLAEETAPGILRQSWQLICKEKKWYLLPLFLAFVLAGSFIFFTGTGAAPLLYTLF